MLVAVRLFRQRSFLATHPDDIAAKVGIIKTATYSDRKGKSRLLSGILAGFHHECIESARAILSTHASLPKKKGSLVRSRLRIRTRFDRLDPVPLFA